MSQVFRASDFPLSSDLPDGPARLAVIGYPVKHSASPQMHQAAINLTKNKLSYIRVEIEPGNVDQDLRKLKEAGFIGVNCTVPHKFDAYDFCAELTESASLLGTVNTILFRDESEGGDLGHNTDGPGFVNAIQASFGKKLSDLKILISGAGGGAGTAIATQAAALGCPKIVLANRSVDKIETLANELRQLGTSEVVALPLTSSEIVEQAHDCDLLINTASLGLKPNDPSPLPAQAFRSGHLAYDTIYNPPETQFLRDAKQAGAKTANGLSLLLHQGALSFELWLKEKPKLQAMERGLNL